MTMSYSALADLIRSNIGSIVQKWRSVVRNDDGIHSDENLSTRELTDHIPQIIEQICELISLDEEPSIATTYEARASVYMRVHQGYSGRDLIGELSLLRMILLREIVTYGLEKLTVLGLEQYFRVSQIINLYIDLEMRYAISVYADLAAGRTKLEEPRSES
jgi:hypothetical protein